MTPGVEEVLIHTGQHYGTNMSQQFFEELDIPLPAHNLRVGSSSHGAQTPRMLERVEELLLCHRPEVVMVYGDTNSTLAAALVAVKLQMPVAHVEAGLRSFNRAMPEEINRVLTNHASAWLFSPTDAATSHLLDEGIPQERVHQVGDVMYDAALHYAQYAHDDVIGAYGLHRGEYALATVHRAENTDDPKRLASIFEGLMALSSCGRVVLPLHPRTRVALHHSSLLEQVAAHVLLLEPVGYLDMIALVRNARLVATEHDTQMLCTALIEAFGRGAPGFSPSL